MRSKFYLLSTYIGLLAGLFLAPSVASAQHYSVSGTVTNNQGDPIPGVHIYVSDLQDTSATQAQGALVNVKTETRTGDEGSFHISGLSKGWYQMIIFSPGKGVVTRELFLREDRKGMKIQLVDLHSSLGALHVIGNEQTEWSVIRMQSVEALIISDAKKNEVLIPSKMAANKAANKGRQIYAKVPGLNIWQNSDAGVQTSIGARGLSPSRSSHFNTRQNGYDIAADALGYPESYYTPPVRALQRIEILRGAAALQYGTQFGGMINYVFKDGSANDPLKIRSTQSAGSYGLFSSFNSIGGSVGDAKYYGFYQYKSSNGWRPNSGMDQHTAYGSVTYRPTSRLTITPEFTYMYYLAQQPGGLTYRQFKRDPRQSNRARNWFRVNWNLFALKADYEFSSRTELNTRFFGLKAGRDAVGNLQRIDRMDLGGRRSLLKDDYRNWGNETRFLHRYELGDRLSYVLLGTRLYNGFTRRRQGQASAGTEPDFSYLNPRNLKGSDYDLPSRNRSVFMENVFNIAPSLSVTGGLRFEDIVTEADGYYRRIVKDLAGNVLIDKRIEEDRHRERSFLFYGLGLSYDPSKSLELYGNYAQNYRAINFNDIRVTVGNLRVDPQIKDEHGFNLDLGIRGQKQELFSYDVSLFYLSYQDRIGTVLRTAPNPRFNGLVDYTFRYRTNVADARIYGLESFAQVDLYKYFVSRSSSIQLLFFSSLALMGSSYVNAQVRGIEGNAIAHVPNINWKTGLTLNTDKLKISYQFSYMGEHFTDATNARETPTAVAGIIPSYHVMDVSAVYHWRRYRMEAGIDNLTNHIYFTRRATGYPGPGIIPAKPRNAYISIGVEF